MIRLLVSIGFASFVASARGELSPVPFAIGKQKFRHGESIVIDQVLSNSPAVDVGTKLEVRGHYHLANSSPTSVGLFVTHISRAEADVVAPSQVTPASTADGSFDLVCDVTAIGLLHVSFYTTSGEESPGGVYFSIGAAAAK